MRHRNFPGAIFNNQPHSYYVSTHQMKYQIKPHFTSEMTSKCIPVTSQSTVQYGSSVEYGSSKTRFAKMETF